MTGIVIIGGGLTGLAAAWALERLRQPYTLIEVKPRLGGSIATHREAGFIMESSAFLLERYKSWPWLADLGLGDALVRFGSYRDGDLVYFRNGAQTLIDALRARLTIGTLLTRMAVSSIGGLPDDGRAGPLLGVCLENGVMLPARAIIITAPARYAAHMLASLSPQAAHLLDGHIYDAIVRVSFGVRQIADPWMPRTLPTAIKYLHNFSAANLPGRVPTGAMMIRAGVRLADAGPVVPHQRIAEAVQAARAMLPPQADPFVTWAHFWPEADSLTRLQPEHSANMDALEALLPPNVVIAGSDYRARRLDRQVEDGRAAARRAVNAL